MVTISYEISLTEARLLAANGVFPSARSVACREAVKKYDKEHERYYVDDRNGGSFVVKDRSANPHSIPSWIAAFVEKSEAEAYAALLLLRDQ